MSLLVAFLKNIVVLFVGIHVIAVLAKGMAGANRIILPEALVYVVFMVGTISFFVWGLIGTLTVLGGYGLLSLSCSVYSRINV
jgi:hypothetical protein